MAGSARKFLDEARGGSEDVIASVIKEKGGNEDDDAAASVIERAGGNEDDEPMATMQSSNLEQIPSSTQPFMSVPGNISPPPESSPSEPQPATSTTSPTAAHIPGKTGTNNPVGFDHPTRCEPSKPNTWFSSHPDYTSSPKHVKPTEITNPLQDSRGQYNATESRQKKDLPAESEATTRKVITASYFERDMTGPSGPTSISWKNHSDLLLTSSTNIPKARSMSKLNFTLPGIKIKSTDPEPPREPMMNGIDHIYQKYASRYADKEAVDRRFVDEIFTTWNDVRDMLSRRSMQRERAIFARNQEIKQLREDLGYRDQKIATQKSALKQAGWENKKLREQLRQAGGTLSKSISSIDGDDHKISEEGKSVGPVSLDSELDKLAMATTMARISAQRSIADVKIYRSAIMIKRGVLQEPKEILKGVLDEMPYKDGVNADLAGRCLFWKAMCEFKEADYKPCQQSLHQARQYLKNVPAEKNIVEMDLLPIWMRKVRRLVVNAK